MLGLFTKELYISKGHMIDLLLIWGESGMLIKEENLGRQADKVHVV